MRAEEFVGVTPGDRLGMTLFFAAVLHTAVVLGISFDLKPRVPPSQTVEVTLAQYQDDEAPEQADFVAQSNQQGSGSEAERREITSPVPEPEGIEAAEAVSTPAAAPRPQPIRQETRTVVTTTAPVPAEPARQRSPEPVDTPPAAQADRPSLLQQSLEIASLEARFLEQRQAYAKRPRVTRVTAVSARRTSSAFYVEAWRNELERVGNLNYPEEARRRSLQGRVRVLVAIEPDGRVSEVAILESSRHKILDDAVVRIVRLAEPFAPFTEDMRKEMDRLEIIRTFDFGSRLSSF